MALILLLLTTIFTTIIQADEGIGYSRYYNLSWFEHPTKMKMYYPSTKYQSKLIPEDPSLQAITDYSQLTGDQAYCVIYLRMLQFMIPHNGYKLISCTNTLPITATISARDVSSWMGVCRAEYPSDDFAHLMAAVYCGGTKSPE